MTINAGLLQATLVRIEANPAAWDQGDWRHCFAGHAVISQGGSWVTDDLTDEASTALAATPEEIAAGDQRFFDLPGGRIVEGVWARERAERILGVSGEQADRLFDRDNTLPALARIVDELCLTAEATDRLAKGEAVELVRDRDGWHVVDAVPRNAPLDSATAYSVANYAIVYGLYEAYQLEHVGHRPGGDMDVLVSATPYDSRPLAYIAFRRDAGDWRPLVGRWSDIATAKEQAEHATQYAGWDSPELRGLLNTLEAVA